ncbi:MAG: 3-dehydroquinate synthase [Pyrinomonadaceae bacterium]
MNEIKKITVAIPGAPHEYEIKIGTNILPELGQFTRKCVGRKTTRVCLISNRKIFGFYGGTARQSLEDADFEVSIFLMPDGEKHKNLRVLEKVLAFFSEKRLTRSDAVVALGGGVVGDLAGFASAIFGRGLPFIQVPTTFLAQIDSSVGGKTAVNTVFGKNLIGAFHQPHGVLIDITTLKTLPLREMRAGLYEAVKQGAIASRILFDQTQDILQRFPPRNFRRDFENEHFLFELQNLIAANIAFKAGIVSGDERENVEREDSRSRRILNFGHTVGHALEKVTLYKRFKHGEAVGLGMRAAAEISNRIGKISKHELNLFSDVVESVGKLPQADNIDPEIVIKAFSHDKKTVGDSFKWILLDGIGRAAITDNNNIPENIVREAVSSVLRQ